MLRQSTWHGSLSIGIKQQVFFCTVAFLQKGEVQIHDEVTEFQVGAGSGGSRDTVKGDTFITWVA